MPRWFDWRFTGGRSVEKAVYPWDEETEICLIAPDSPGEKHSKEWRPEVSDGSVQPRRPIRVSLSAGVRWSCTLLNLVVVASLLVFLFQSLGLSPSPVATSSAPSTTKGNAASANLCPATSAQSVLPSCSMLNSNLTDNLLHYIHTIQTPQLNADCTDYPFTGMCVTNTISSTGDTTMTPIRPQWLVFHIHSGPNTEGAGGLADRLKGLLTALPIALLTGRAFGVHATDYLPFSHIYGRGELNWVEWEGIPAEVRAGSSIRLDNWYNHVERPISNGQHNWRWEWRHSDIVEIRFNLNGFPELADNQHLLPAYRAFGFHAATEKGDMDVYWECLMDFAFTYQPAVTAVLNPLLKQLNRPPVLTWAERQEHPERVALSPYARLLGAGPGDESECSVGRLYCAQIRMGANGQQKTGNGTIGFSDSESFIGQSSFDSIFAQLEQLIDQHQHNLSVSSPTTCSSQPYSLFITSDSNSYQSALPARWADIKQLSVPGYTAHIDKLSDVADQYDVVLAAFVKTVVTHYLLGECDVAAVSATGFGTTARWRTRNRQLLGKPFSAAAYTNTRLIRTADASFAQYRHKRGSDGREVERDYFPMGSHLRAVMEAEVLTDHAMRASLIASQNDSFQSSSALPFEPPVDPACRGRRSTSRSGCRAHSTAR